MKDKDIPSPEFEPKKRINYKQYDVLTVKAKAQEGCLDDIVHDLKSREASDINNSGIDAQVLYMVASIGVNHVIEEIEDVLK